MHDATDIGAPKGWTKIEDKTLPGLARVVYYCPSNNDRVLDVARAYWQGGLEGLTTVRQHKWGGRVEHVFVEALGKTLYFKRFSIRSPRYIHKPRRARNTLLHQLEASALGFNVPNSVCLIEKRLFGVVVDSTIVTEAIEDVVSFHNIINEAGHLDSVEQRRSFLRQFGHEAGRWHGAGLFHGDMHLDNVLCRRDGDKLKFYWIDNEEGTLFRQLPIRQRVHDLHHLNRFKHKLSLTDRMRLWDAYCEHSGLSSREHKTVMRRVMAKSQAYWRKRGWM